MPLRRLTLLACALVAALPATADAATQVTTTDGGATVLIRSTDDGAFTRDNSVEVTVGGEVEIVENDGDGTVDPGGACQFDGDSQHAKCPVAGVTRIVFDLGPGDDGNAAHGLPVRLEVDGGAGDDTLTGGDAGDLLVGGPGADFLDGRGGNDRLESADGAKDGQSDCGAGDDDIDDDATDGYPTGCEVVAPEHEGTAVLSGTPRAFEVLTIDFGPSIVLHGTINHPSQTDAARFYRCDAAGQGCVLVQEDDSLLSRILTSDDVGTRLYGELHIANRAGSHTVRTPLSDVIAPGTLPAPPPVPYYDPAGYFDPMRPPLPSLGSVLRTEMKRAGARLAKTSLRKLASAKTLALAFTAPVPGNYSVDLRVPAKAARKLGARGNRPVVLARGAVRTSGVLKNVTVRLKPTKAGRKLMRKAKRLETTIAASLQQPGEDATLQVTQPLKLRRR